MGEHKGIHESHKMRYSDSSCYDEICDLCMQPDWCTKENKKLIYKCKGNTMAKWTLDNKDDAYLQELTNRLKELERQVDMLEQEIREVRDDTSNDWRR